MPAERRCPRLLPRLLAVVLLAMPGLSSGPPAAAQAPPPRHGAAAVTLREPPPDALVRYRHDPAFDYGRKAVGESWWTAFRRWLGRSLYALLGGRPAVRYLLYAAAAAIVVYAVLGLLRMEGSTPWTRGEAARVPAAPAPAEESMDLDAAIAAAAARSDYREAVRLTYLQALRRLADAGLIRWQTGTTNHAYERALAEQGGAALAAAFGDLTYLFEYAWYGNFPVGAPLFAAATRAAERLDAACKEAAP